MQKAVGLRFACHVGFISPTFAAGTLLAPIAARCFLAGMRMVSLALWTHCPPELLSCQLCILSRKSLDAYDAAWLVANKRHIQAMAVIGQTLQKGVSMPLELVLQETAALLEDAA